MLTYRYKSDLDFAYFEFRFNLQLPFSIGFVNFPAKVNTSDMNFFRLEFSKIQKRNLTFFLAKISVKKTNFQKTFLLSVLSVETQLISFKLVQFIQVGLKGSSWKFRSLIKPPSQSLYQNFLHWKIVWRPLLGLRREGQNLRNMQKLMIKTNF